MKVETSPRGQTMGQGRVLRPVLLLAAVLAVAAALHLADHAIRGEIVDDHGLIPEWDHSGWPFQDEVTPFTPSLAIPLLFMAGIFLTLRRRVLARFWLVLTIVVGAVVVAVHFAPGDQTETLGVIYRTYDHGGWSAVWGALAVANVVLIVTALVALSVLAARLRRGAPRR